MSRTGFTPAFARIDAIRSDMDVAGNISPSKNYAWNFDNVGGRRKIGTVEFRRPAMSTCAQYAAAFTFAFVRAAGAIDDDGFAATGEARTRGLEDFY